MDTNLIPTPNVRRINFTPLVTPAIYSIPVRIDAPQVQKIELPIAPARRQRAKKQVTPAERAAAYPLSDAQLVVLPEYLQEWYLSYLQGKTGSVGINTLRRSVEKALNPQEIAARKFHAANPDHTVCKKCNEILDWGWCSRCGEYR